MSELTVTFLGTGTSTGIPMVGCSCSVCTSANPKDTRLRPSILVESNGARVLVDTTPDMRYQLLRAGVTALDAILYTHPHADHLLGLDDVRPLNSLNEMVMPLYGSAMTLEQVRKVFDYCFKETQKGGGKPQLSLHEIAPYSSFRLGGLDVLPLWHYHGRMPVNSFVFGSRFAYVTDVSAIPWLTWKALKGIDTLVLGTVRRERHPSHLSLGEALAVARDLGARQTYLTHLSHYLGHDETTASLPDNVAIAYDGLKLSLS